MSGRLTGITPAMTESLLRVENQAVRGTAAGVRQLQRLDEDLRGAMIDASGFEASGPIKRFANTYHGLLRIAIDDNSFNTRALRAAYDSNRKIDTLLRTLEKGLAAGRPGSLGTSLLTARSSFATLLRFQQEQSGREVLKTRQRRLSTKRTTTTIRRFQTS